MPISVRTTQELGGPCTGVSVAINGGKVRTQGIELETQYRAMNDLEISFSLSFVDAEFMDDAISAKGDRLPSSPKFNGSIGLEYDFTLAGREGFLRADYSYVDEYFPADFERSAAPSGNYGILGARIGINVSDQLSIEMYGTNLTNNDKPTYTSLFTTIRLRPRIVGIDMSYHF